MNININQDTSRVELLGDSGAGILQKLYDLDKTNDIQTLSGNIKINVGYEDIVEYLTTKYPNLSIDVVAYAFKFEDSILQDLMETKVFKTASITSQMVRTLVDIPYESLKAKKFVKFNEFKDFTGLSQFSGQMFEGCNKLEELTLPTTCNASKLPFNFVNGCYKLKRFDIPDYITTTEQGVCLGCVGIEGYLIFPHTITTFGGRTFGMDTWHTGPYKTKGVFVLSTNFPTFNSNENEFEGNVSYPVYVKYAHYSQYASRSNFIGGSQTLKAFKLFRYTSSNWVEVINPTASQVREALNNISSDWTAQILPSDDNFPSSPTEGQLSLMIYTSVS